MERHDTHILSDSQEDDEKEDNAHFYEFNDSDNSECNSLKNTIQSNSKKESKFNLNEIIQTKNNDENELFNDSIVSIQDLDDIFYNENRFTKNSVKTKDKEKESNNNVSKIKDKDEKKNSSKEKIQDSKKKIMNKSSVNKIPDSIKIKLIKLNYDDNDTISISNKLHTYTPSLKNKIKIKKIKRKRNCISFENDKEKIKYKLKTTQLSSANKNNNIRIQTKKKSNEVSESNSDKESLNNGGLGNNKMKNLFEMIKNTNLKSFKISTNSFTIMTKDKEHSVDGVNSIKKRLKDSKSLGFQFSNKIQKQNDFYLKQEYEYNLLKRYNFSPGKIQINGKKRFQILQSKKEDNANNKEYSSKFIITNNNNSQYSLRYHNNSSNNNFKNYIRDRNSNEYNSNYVYDYNNEINNEDNEDYNNQYNNRYNYNNINDDYISCINRMNRMNMYNVDKSLKRNTGLRLKNDKKIKILYDLYCKRPRKEYKSISRINSAYSLQNGRTRMTNYPNTNHYMDLNVNFDYNDNMIKNRLYNNNNSKNWLLKLIKIKRDKNMFHYEKHFGNNESCPLCQQMDKRNEEQIRKIGIYHMASDNKKSESRSNSKKKRRINSAFPNFHSNYVGDEFSKENDNNASKNNLKCNKSSALFNEYNLRRNLLNKNHLKRKLQLTSKQRYMSGNFS